MTSHPNVRLLPGTRTLRTTIFSSTAVVGSVAIAGVASATIPFLVILANALGLNGSFFQWMKPLIATAGFVTVGGSKPVVPPPTIASVEQSASKPDSNADVAASGKRAMKLGVNLLMPTYYGGARAFSNLALQGSWGVRDSNGKDKEMTGLLDRNQNLVNLAPGDKAGRTISAPTKGLLGQSVDIVCHWSGKAKVSLGRTAVRNPRIGVNSLTFTFVPEGGYLPLLSVSEVDNTNPFRDLDCREADADPDAVFDPAYVAEISRYNTVRFMKWQTAVERNTPIHWADRSRPTSNAYLNTTDGVSIEQMVLLANEAKTNPWFCMPWNADDEYIRKFAEYVRDHLDRGLIVYVETSNEVWNFGYKVTVQARNEGEARGLLAPGDGGAVLGRYAERTGEVMDIWTEVFADNPKRLVRVAATQNAVPWAAEMLLKNTDIASKVDALATAPYFNWHFESGSKPSVDFFSKELVGRMDLRLANAAKNKALASAKGLRYITYEAGQHVTIATGEQVPMLIGVQHDPRMGDLYTRYLTTWKDEFGDLMVLFAAWGPTNKYGAWGMQEYLGQPLNQAPKAKAVDLFSRSYVTKN